MHASGHAAQYSERVCLGELLGIDFSLIVVVDLVLIQHCAASGSAAPPVTITERPPPFIQTMVRYCSIICTLLLGCGFHNSHFLLNVLFS